MEFLKSAVASAILQTSSFPYSFGDKVDVDDSIWTLHNGTRREDGSNCSIFSFDISPAKRSLLPLAKNALKKLRTMRHPGVIRVLDTEETDAHIYIATERVVPLRWHVRRKSLSPETVKWGLFSVAKTLKFINGDASSIHGSLRVGSIYTSESGEWKLAGFEVLSSVKDDEATIYTFGSVVPDSARYAPPEVAQGSWGVIKKNPISAVDSFNYGTLIYEVFNGDFHGSSSIGQTNNIPPTMQSSYKRLCNANPKARTSIANFLDQGKRSGSFFDSPLIKLTEDLDNLGVKSDDEREEFLANLKQVTDDFPQEFFASKVLPELMKSVEFSGGGSAALNVVLTISVKLPADDFDAKITPFIVRMFANPDRAIRLCLLDALPSMIDRLSQKIVNDKIFPHLVTGFTDLSPVLRETTLKSVLVIISKLSDRTINGELLKQLAKTANDEQPGIRTNTAICLGRIAKNLGTSTRSKVLIAAFTRSLRDPFVHARNASLMALAATAEHFSAEDSAARILPVVCPALIDKEKLVRDQANRTMEVYLEKIRKASASMPDSVLPAAQTADGQAAQVSSPPQPTGGSSAGWAGWAISSFTNKLSAVAGDMQTTEAPAAAVPETKTPASAHRQVVTSPSPAASGLPSRSASAVAQAFLPEADADDAGDAWGDMEDDDAAFSTPLESAQTPATASATPFGDEEPDFAGWLAAQSQKKSGKPLPKGLSKTTAPSTTAKKALSKATPAAKKPAVTKKIDMKPKETDDDDWGEGW